MAQQILGMNCSKDIPLGAVKGFFASVLVLFLNAFFECPLIMSRPESMNSSNRAVENRLNMGSRLTLKLPLPRGAYQDRSDVEGWEYQQRPEVVFWPSALIAQVYFEVWTDLNVQFDRPIVLYCEYTFCNETGSLLQ